MALNWPGLLAWSTKYHDGTAPSEFQQMTDEDRKFLEEAMKEALGKIENPNEVMKEAIAKMSAQDRTNESITTALEIIDRCCDDPDVARNVEILNGLQPLLDLLVTHSGSIRCRALEILALLFSNNPKIQQVGMDRGALKQFVQMTKDAARGSDEKSKAFRALVALVRQMPASEEHLLRNADGVYVIIDCLSRAEEMRTREKALSFSRSLACDGRLEPADAGLLIAAITPLLKTLSSEDGIQYRETLAECIHEFAKAFPHYCPPVLSMTLQVRLEMLRKAEDARKAEDPSNENEMSSLQQCMDLLPKKD